MTTPRLSVPTSDTAPEGYGDDTYRRPYSIDREALVYTEQRQSEERVLSEASPTVALGIELLISQANGREIAEIVDLIDAQPHVFAARFNQLERRLDDMERRLGGLRGAIR